MATSQSNGVVDSKSRWSRESTIPFWLDGKEVTSEAGFDVISPLDHQVLYQCASASEQNVANAISSAQKAFRTWSQTKPKARQDIFLRAAEGFRQRRDEFRHYSYTETGGAEAMFAFEHNAAYEMCKSVAGLIQVATESSSPVVDADNSSALVLKEPYGVVLAIAPWNAPNVLGLRSFLQPLAMGNTVILKGPEASPACYWALASVFHEAGLPAGCLNTLYHKQQDAARITGAIIANPAIRKINFTGSTAVGSIIASLAGKHMKPVVMELGGKAPAIVCEDADIQKAALQCVIGAFLNAGQICMSTERIIVNAKIAAPFRDALQKTMQTMFEGGKFPLPQLVSQLPVTKNKKLVADALSKGASTLYGNEVHDDSATSTTMHPVVIEGVTPQMDVYQQESFGPTVALYVVNTDEEAVQLANDTEYGLSSAIFTEDLRRGFKLARQIESGAVHINAMTVHDETALPHGGVKSSGFGRFNGLPGLNEWVKTKIVTWQD